MEGRTGATIPWWRAPSFSFTSSSDAVTDIESLSSRSSGRARKSSLSSHLAALNVLPVDPCTVYPREGHVVDHNAIALSSDGAVALLARADSRVGVVHTLDGARGDFTAHATDKATRQVAISADGRIGASASLDGTVRIFDTDTLAQLAVLRQTGFAWANGVALSADGAIVIASFTPKDSDRGRVVRFDWAARAVTVLWQGFHRVFEVRCSHDASRVLFIRQGGSIIVLDATPGEKPRQDVVFTYMKGDFDVAMDALGSRFLIVDKSLRLHTLEKGARVIDSFDHFRPASPRNIGISADGSRTIELTRRGLNVRSVPSGALIAHLRHKLRLSACAVSADGATFVATDSQANLVIWRPDALPKTDLVCRAATGASVDLRGRASVASLFTHSPYVRPSPSPRSPVSSNSPFLPPTAIVTRRSVDSYPRADSPPSANLPASWQPPSFGSTEFVTPEKPFSSSAVSKATPEEKSSPGSLSIASSPGKSMNFVNVRGVSIAPSPPSSGPAEGDASTSALRESMSHMNIDWDADPMTMTSVETAVPLTPAEIRQMTGKDSTLTLEDSDLITHVQSHQVIHESNPNKGGLSFANATSLRGLMFDSLPSKQKLKEFMSEDELRAAQALEPSFPTLEPERSSVQQVYRGAFK